jgi:hypothetical protein
MITVACERLHGVRAINQRCDGGYEVSVTKVVDVPPSAVRALTSLRPGSRVPGPGPARTVARWGLLGEILKQSCRPEGRRR